MLMNRVVGMLFGLCGVLLIAFAQLPTPAPQPIVGARMPALSPDGSQIAFVYRGDIWVAPGAGGRAMPITRHVAYDAYLTAEGLLQTHARPAAWWFLLIGRAWFEACARGLQARLEPLIATG